MKVETNFPLVSEKISMNDVPDGTLLVADTPGEMFHNDLYLKVAGCISLVNLTTAGRSYRNTTGKIYRRVPSGTKVTLIQE